MADPRSLAIRKPKEPPLTKEEFTEVDETGVTVKVTRYRRGVLVREARQYDPSNIRAWRGGATVRQELEAFCDALRDMIESAGFPSDRTPKWIKIADGEWRPENDNDDRELIPTVPTAYALWIHRLGKTAEPLSHIEAAGKLLWALSHLLKRKKIDEHLWDIGQVMEHYASYRLSGNINHYASMGVAARLARAKGPQASQRRRNRVREIVWAHAIAHWSSNPRYEGDAWNTAACIACAVNTELRDRRLLPGKKTGLQPKTISDHIRCCPKQEPIQIANLDTKMAKSEKITG
jgi:hypothetical protein